MQEHFARTDDPQFQRDRTNGAVLNTDNKALQQYKDQRTQVLSIKKMSEELNSLKADMSTIKELLGKLVANG